MGCVSSKLFKQELKQEVLLNNGGDYINHVVSLTSSTYGVLNLESDEPQQEQQRMDVDELIEKIKRKSPPRDGLEVINSWELMEGLDEEENQQQQRQTEQGRAAQVQRSPKVSSFVRGIDSISPMKFFSPRKGKKFGSGKENRAEISTGPRRAESSPSGAPRSVNKLKKVSPNLKILTERNWMDPKNERVSRRRSLSPLFDPELLASIEKDLTEKENEFKRSVNSLAPNRKSISSIKNAACLDSFVKKCPPGGEDSVIIYTTTLRGIRKTFEDCNIVRSIMESYGAQMFERDISMDSGFKEELRKLMGVKEVKVPAVFIKGRMIGGAEVVGRMDEEGSLGQLLEGIPRAAAGVGGGCVGCGGVRFVMCGVCNGSCKVLDDKGRKSLKCGECNENGLIHCPVCS
uniref:Glutaredoxin domain-containing protein n=1 Tax=Kalanchoe fedtschenkoi TaxID=63787 RepID=A0A7N0THG4_KALFE